MANIPAAAVGASVGVLLYSFICWFLSTMLLGLLITFGEKTSYVTIHSSFTSLSTLASIIQQIHFAIRWRVIKEAQFRKAIRAMDMPGLPFVGGAHPVDMTLFFIQFWCYNTMALNIFFWSVDLFTSSWGYRTPWLGDWVTRIGPISKIFSIIFPALIIGLMNSPAVLRHGATTFIISDGMIFLTLTSGSILLSLILYKYMKTRRLATGGSRRGGWWASRDTKSNQSRDIGSNYIPGTANISTRSSIYDRALVTRFSIGFVILAFFLGAIVVFSYISSTTNTSVATADRPDFSTKGAITDIVLFIPGVTASLATFLVFGTAKGWRQYRDLLIGGCGIRNKLIQRTFQRQREDEENRSSTPDEGNGAIALSTLPRLQTTLSEQERVRDEEAEKRVRMFSREVHGGRDGGVGNSSRHKSSLSEDASMYRPDTAGSLINYAQKPGVSPATKRHSDLSFHVRAESPTLVRGNSKMQFHTPRPSLTTEVSGGSMGSGFGVIEVGLEGGKQGQARPDVKMSPLTMNTPKVSRIAPVIDIDKVRSDSRDPY